MLELREAVGQLQALLDVPAASGSAPAAGAALCDERAVRRLDVQLYRAALAVQVREAMWGLKPAWGAMRKSWPCQVA